MNVSQTKSIGSSFVLSYLCASLLLASSCTSTRETAATKAAETASRPAPERTNVVDIRRDAVPVVYFRAMVLSGSADDPFDKPGLAWFTANLMRRGTKRFSRERIDETLDRMAATLNVSVGKDQIVFSGTTLRENLDEFHAIFADVLLHPTFPDSEVEKMRADQIDAIEAVRQSDEALARECFNNVVYEGHPYGHLDAGTISAVKSFTRSDVEGFFRKHLVRQNVLFGVAGATDDTIVARLRDDAAALPAGSVSHARPTPRMLARRSALLVEKDGRAQTHLRIGHALDVTRRDPADYFPLRVARTYLGEHRESIGRLYQTVREQRGLSYGAYAYIEHFTGQGGATKLPTPNIARRQQVFSMWIYPKSENAKFVTKLALKELSELAASGLPDPLLSDMKSFTRNHFVFEVETPDRQLAMRLDDAISGTADYATEFESGIARVTSEDVRRATRTRLHPEALALVAIVSDGPAFVEELLAPETRVEYPSGVDPNALESEDATVKAVDLGLRREDFRIVKAKDLFQ